jgi:hypothetical protein
MIDMINYCSTHQPVCKDFLPSLEKEPLLERKTQTPRHLTRTMQSIAQIV